MYLYLLEATGTILERLWGWFRRTHLVSFHCLARVSHNTAVFSVRVSVRFYSQRREFGMEDLSSWNTERRRGVLQPAAVRHAGLLTKACWVSLRGTECLSAPDPITNQTNSKQCDAFRYIWCLTLQALHDPRRGSTRLLWSHVISPYTEYRPPHMLLYMSTEILGIGYSLIYHEQNWWMLCVADVFRFSPVFRLTLNKIINLRWITTYLHVPFHP
jgi:hypothetical protein